MPETYVEVNLKTV